MKNKFMPQLLKIFIFEHRYMFKMMRKRYKKHLKKLLIENNGKSLSIDDEKNWIKKLNKLTYSLPELIEVGDAFASSEITILKDCKIHDSDVIAICVEKNDSIKLKKFITHHRKLGIDKFIILDNDSNDGTIEWLLKQNDVVLFQTKLPYRSYRRVGWINRIIAHYGYNRWYFVADSDELLVYDNCENKTIQDVIKYCKKTRITRARAVMVDMYAKPAYYSCDNMESYYEECKYFDCNTYSVNKSKFNYNVNGGPRARIFNVQACLTKYPLFYFKKSDVFRSHFLYPCKDNFVTDCNLVLKHYKFLPGEIKKYKKIVDDGNYFQGSREYKKYLEFLKACSRLDFICDSTEEYKNSSSLEKISIYNKINWKILDNNN